MGWMSSPWFWWAIALALFAAEAMMPGTFMLWLGFAAVATSLVDLVITLSPTVQWLIFGVFSLISVAMGWRWRATHKDSPSDQPLLNQRGAQLVGRVFPLETAIVNGRGRVKVGDAFWAVEGQDMDAGTRIRVVAVDGMVLRVDLAP